MRETFNMNNQQTLQWLLDQLEEHITDRKELEAKLNITSD